MMIFLLALLFAVVEPPIEEPKEAKAVAVISSRNLLLNSPVSTEFVISEWKQIIIAPEITNPDAKTTIKLEISDDDGRTRKHVVTAIFKAGIPARGPAGLTINEPSPKGRIAIVTTTTDKTTIISVTAKDQAK